MNLVKNQSGITLLVVLWIVFILSVLALGLYRKSSVDLLLIRRDVANLRAYAAAKAGIHSVQQLLSKDKTEDTTSTLNIDEGISVSYKVQNEEGKIDLNALDNHNYLIFSQLLQEFDVEQGEADSIAAAVVDWHSNTDIPIRSPDGDTVGAKSDYYLNQSTPYRTKNRPYDYIQEILFVKGMTKQLFVKIRDYITVFPKNPLQGFKINFYTASDEVIRAAVKGLVHNSEEDLIEALINQKEGLANFSLSVSQQLQMNSLMNAYGVAKPEYFRVRSIGVDEATRLKVILTAIIYKPRSQGQAEIVSWYRE